MTLRPFGPSVTRTALLRISTPRNMRSRASPENFTSLAAISVTPLNVCAERSGQHAHDVALLHDQEVLAVELDLGARPLAEQHAVADLEVDRDQLAGFVTAARTHRGDFALRGLFLGGVRNDDAALGLFFGFDSLDHDTVMQRTKFGFSHEGSFWRVVCRSGLTVDRNTRRIRHRRGQNSSHSLAITLSEC